jgi:cell wall-associated NlpC family hydrolase
LARLSVRPTSGIRRKTALHRIRSKHLRVAWALLLIAVSVAMAPSAATSAPSIGELRAQVARIQAEVAAIDTQVEAAAEAYNGAVYNLGQIQSRIRANGELLRRAKRDLAKAREILGARLRAAYMQPPPSRIQLILSSGSVSSFLGGAEALERASSQDAAIVRGVQALRQRTIVARRELLADQSRANDEVAARQRQRDIVTALLNQRQAVLSGAKGRLGKLIEAQRARERAAAAAARKQALERLHATQSVVGGAAGSNPLAASAGVVSGPGSAANAQAANLALQYLGVPYVWGGASPSGFDCSGLVSYVYAKVGKSVPHFTGAEWAAFPRVTGALQPGDLVFFHNLGHVGIYIGGGQMVHAPHTGDVVRVASLSGHGSYVGAVRP